MAADRVQEPGGRSSVCHAVVEGKAQGDHVPGDDPALVYCRFGDNPAHTQNGALRQVDDGCKDVDPVRPQVRNCKRTPLKMLRFEVSLPWLSERGPRFRGRDRAGLWRQRQ